MKREERFEVIAVSCKKILQSLADEVTKFYKINVIKNRNALIMMQVRDSVEKEKFYLGEVLVSEAEVEIEGVPGYSMVLGNDTEKSLSGAVLDAVCELNHPLKDKIIKVLNQEKINYKKERDKEWARIKSTKVKFEEMD